MFYLKRPLYYKRHRMEINFHRPFVIPPLPPGYEWVPWNDDLLETHAEVKYRSFAGEIDSYVFPNLGSRKGCLRLMKAITSKPSFVPMSTWLIRSVHGSYCGTVQGVVDRGPVGSIQNVGIVPSERGNGLGRLIVLKSLNGFLATGLPRVYLDVTEGNNPAISLYRSLGFKHRKTTLKVVNPWQSFFGE